MVMTQTHGTVGTPESQNVREGQVLPVSGIFLDTFYFLILLYEILTFTVITGITLAAMAIVTSFSKNVT